VNKALMILVLSFAPSSALAQASPTNNCEPWEIQAHIVANDLNGALKYSEECVAYHMAESPKNPNTPVPFGLLHVLEWGFHLCGRAQVQAMMGDKTGADASIKEAEKVSGGDWKPSFDFSMNNWPETIEPTIGFVLEKSGDIEGAKHWYFEHRSNYATERLAVLALYDSNIQDAARYAGELLAGGAKDPTAHVVMGAVLETKGEKTEALAEYQIGLHQMTREELDHNFFPIVVAESSRAKLAIARLTHEVR
jgi:hypothetical protein